MASALFNNYRNNCFDLLGLDIDRYTFTIMGLVFQKNHKETQLHVRRNHPVSLLFYVVFVPKAHGSCHFKKDIYCTMKLYMNYLLFSV